MAKTNLWMGVRVMRLNMVDRSYYFENKTIKFSLDISYQPYIKKNLTKIISFPGPTHPFPFSKTVPKLWGMAHVDLDILI